jgi:transcriptional regulator with XRE-family HTH domain
MLFSEVFNIYNGGSMVNYNFGDLIRTLRKQRGMKQDELAGPTIDRATISKIETGKAMPKKRVLQTLLDKLNYDSQNIPSFFLSAEEVRIYNIMNDIDSFLSYQKKEEAMTLISELENDKRFMENTVNKQYIIFSKILAQYRETDYFAIVIKLLMDAIKLTIPSFKLDDIGEYHISKQELSIIIKMAECYHDNDQNERAISILYALKDNFDNKCIDRDYKGKHYPMVLNHLAFYLSSEKKHLEVVKLCDMGMDICRDTKNLYNLPHLTLTKALSLHELGENEESGKLIRIAYNGYLLYNQTLKALETKKYISDRFGIVL